MDINHTRVVTNYINANKFEELRKMYSLVYLFKTIPDIKFKNSIDSYNSIKFLLNNGFNITLLLDKMSKLAINLLNEKDKTRALDLMSYDQFKFGRLKLFIAMTENGIVMNNFRLNIIRQGFEYFLSNSQTHLLSFIIIKYKFDFSYIKPEQWASFKGHVQFFKTYNIETIPILYAAINVYNYELIYKLLSLFDYNIDFFMFLYLIAFKYNKNDFIGKDFDIEHLNNVLDIIICKIDIPNEIFVKPINGHRPMNPYVYIYLFKKKNPIMAKLYEKRKNVMSMLNRINN